MMGRKHACPFFLSSKTTRWTSVLTRQTKTDSSGYLCWQDAQAQQMTHGELSPSWCQGYQDGVFIWKHGQDQLSLHLGKIKRLARRVAKSINQPVCGTTEGRYFYLKSYVVFLWFRIISSFQNTCGEVRTVMFSLSNKRGNGGLENETCARPQSQWAGKPDFQPRPWAPAPSVLTAVLLRLCIRDCGTYVLKFTPLLLLLFSKFSSSYLFFSAILGKENMFICLRCLIAIPDLIKFMV